ncbi:hypothetical protein BDN70DRAFT_909882 [Pholiota conissans]|uniref:Uncharacterized protein n=1 Tax=Pholiota conissans TaxID=109636 RepID=A0A9P5ZEP2_9AGAR|nr:hypothetical protein BDN70DRAFT_909882 [Pholiota conissans]
MKTLLLTFTSLFVGVLADGDGAEFTDDPYLKYRPAFARSLPIQILLTGVVLTLVAVLFIHLMFTAQYHWPLAPVNYVLQLSGVTTLLISLIATLHVVMSATFAESEKWPYMLSYIAVNVPPLDLVTNTESWSIAERATWLVMNASTSGLIQITHIQFLTLLYPSRLEGRLIFTLLGPLAIVAAVMQLLPISNHDNVNQVASAVRNVCNATLSLLFTLALFIWGLLVNRKQAWRTDGGTAVFGCAALSLAVISTALNFLYVHKEEEFVWLPGLMWAVVLWQSFLGWWWWVGAGSGRAFSSEEETMEEKLRREAKRERRRREARERKKETKMRAQKMWKGVAGAFVRDRDQSRSPSPSRSPSHDLTPDGDDSNARPRVSRGDGDDSASQLSHASSATITGSFTGVTTTQTYTTLPRVLPRFVHQWYASLRREHNAAARMQAEERVRRMRSMGRQSGRCRTSIGENGEGVDDIDGEQEGGEHEQELPSVVGWGWGWHGFGWRRRGADEPTQSASEKGYELEKRRERRRKDWKDESGYEMQTSGQKESKDEDEEEKDDEVEDEDDIYVSDAAVDGDEIVEERRPAPLRRERDTEWRRRHQQQQNTASDDQVAAATRRPERRVDTTSNSIWWWGPLKRWRLKDSTIY